MDEAVFEQKLLLLSEAQSTKIKGFHRWQDAYCSLWGNLLLLEGLKELGITTTLQHLRYNQYGKLSFSS
ncbi:hypothetical protein [Paraflavitalea speifideaquila]|uniref:hypothetical protein n=1 Tax=Paraflavitalea speifideaquila TaxID=3076558 RepID=UPI0028E274EF|nr:hypothetical protein [Paraflavitalea speifideiaquila]